ncbi:MAG: hypothetical protein B6I31_03040 [Desulfobacteraceae bacterium 4572_19]|nr:MAG: hypothetical protein B6I31_03040 [Desulfobacteraceae bacterium 4572_19]
MKKVIFFILLMLLFIVTIKISICQSLVVHTADGTTHQFSIAEINSITFPTGNTQNLWIVTTEAYPETANLDSIVIATFGPNYRVADWNDLVDYSLTHSIEEWADSIGMQNGDGDYYITRDGNHFWNKTNRHYYIARHDHIVPPNFLVHAHIDNHFIDLGSWYNLMKRILCIRTDYSLK